jgi:hypothetical protein
MTDNMPEADRTSLGDLGAMEHLAFYNHGCQPAPGASKMKLWVRRQARRAILPMCQRLVEILASVVQRLDQDEHEIRALRGELDDLRRRHDEQAAKVPATLAFGWDYVAMVRRLAVLEEHVDALLTRDRAQADQSSVRLAGLEPEAN